MEKMRIGWEKINSMTADIGDLLDIKWTDGGRFMMDRSVYGRVIKHSKNRIFIKSVNSNNMEFLDEIPYTKIEQCLRKIEFDADLGI